MTCLHFLSGIANGVFILVRKKYPRDEYLHTNSSQSCASAILETGDCLALKLILILISIGSNPVCFLARASILGENQFLFPLPVIHSLNFPTVGLHILDIATNAKPDQNLFLSPPFSLSFFVTEKWWVEIVLLGPPSLADQKGTGSAQCIEMRGKEANYILKPQLHRALSFCSTFDSILIPRIRDSSCCSVMHYLLLLLVTKNPG